MHRQPLTEKSWKQLQSELEELEATMTDEQLDAVDTPKTDVTVLDQIRWWEERHGADERIWLPTFEQCLAVLGCPEALREEKPHGGESYNRATAHL